jgi:AcrR family transcriptional regulator
MSAHQTSHDRTAAAILDAAAHQFAEAGPAASMGDVAATAGVSRATLYRYFPSREELLAALAAEAVADAGARLADAGLEHVPFVQALERIVRALVTVGDRYAVLAHDHVRPDPAEVERVLGAPIRAVFDRGAAGGELRDDLPVDVLLELFGGVLTSALKLAGQRRLGLEDAAAAATELFLDGARRR